MNRMKSSALFLTIFSTVAAAACLDSHAAVGEADVIVYGSTPAGLTAAIEAQACGKTAIVVSPETRIGGMTTGGLGQTDVGSCAAYGGLCLRFYRDIHDYYADPGNWKWQKPRDFAPRGQVFDPEGWDSKWLFSPSAALSVLEGWEKRYGLRIRRGERLVRAKDRSGVEARGGRIASIRTESGNVYRGKVFVDATYEGDLMAEAGVSYFVGREANSVYGEELSGFQPNPRHGGHRLKSGIDPYVVKGDPSSGLLPGVLPYEAVKDRKPGDGDNHLQAYNYRMCLTDVEANRIPFKKPEGYDESLYELLFRNFEAGETQLPRNQALMPDAKTDTNNHGGFSTDFIGQNWNYAEASYEEREKIAKRHLVYQQGLMWTLANHPRVPKEVREEFSRWGTCRDEFLDGPGDGWQRQMYIREARRMVGEYVMTEHNCRRERIAEKPVAQASYGMDSHHSMRYVGEDGFVHNEGDIQDWRACGVPYTIDYRAIVPKRGECANLLVPVCLSASHMAFGSIRMEPVFFELGQAAGAAAAIACEDGVAVQDVDYARLRDRLVRDGMYLEGKSDVSDPALPFRMTDDFDASIAELRRLNSEYGIRRIFLIGCPGHVARILGWEDGDERYESFTRLALRVKEAVAGTGMEIGWWNSPTITIGKGGPFQMMVGGDGREATHAVCPLEKGFRDAVARRVKKFAAVVKPWAIMFEDETHFGWQRDVKKLTCYCPLHLKDVSGRVGREVSREELVAACERPADGNLALRSAFAASMRDTMRVFGRELRAAVDEVSPMTRMGMCVQSDFERDGDAMIVFAREIAGGGRPFVRNAASLYGWGQKVYEEISSTAGTTSWGYRWLPPDFEILQECDTYPHNRFFMPGRQFEDLLLLHAALGADDVLLYATQHLDDPAEDPGYLDAYKRARPRIKALKKARRGTRPCGVQLMYRHSQDNIFRYANLPTLCSGGRLLGRYGVPFCMTDMPVKMLLGADAERLSDADIRRLMGRNVLLDGAAALNLCRRGFADMIGADVSEVPFQAAKERICDGVAPEVKGRRIYSNAFAAAGAEKSTAVALTNLRKGAERLVDYVGGRDEILPAPAMYRYVNAEGGRIAVVAAVLTENKSSSVFSFRKRKVVVDTLRWLAGDAAPLSIWATVKNEPNVMLVARTPNSEAFLLLTVVNMSMDRLEKVEIELDPHYSGGSVEELGADGTWRPGSFAGAYTAGEVRVFRISRQATAM